MIRWMARPGQRRWQRWLEAGLDVLFPPRCAGCGLPGSHWCPACAGQAVRLRPPLCARCGGELAPEAPCSDCRSGPFPLVARSYARYDGPVRKAVLQLKYRPNRRLAMIMAEWLADVSAAEPWSPAMIVPVPLAGDRMRLRGYNQAGLMAAALGDLLALPVKDHALRRVRETPSQVGLDPASRWRNVLGAFRGSPVILQDQIVLLVDDLYTTGATLAACAQASLEAGAASVYAVTVARARHQGPGAG